MSDQTYEVMMTKLKLASLDLWVESALRTHSDLQATMDKAAGRINCKLIGGIFTIKDDGGCWYKIAIDIESIAEPLQGRVT
jgi:hypothetical protein